MCVQNKNTSCLFLFHQTIGLNCTYINAEIRLQNPFLVNLNTIDNLDLVKDELIDLKTNEMTRQNFQTKV